MVGLSNGLEVAAAVAAELKDPSGAGLEAQLFQRQYMGWCPVMLVRLGRGTRPVPLGVIVLGGGIGDGASADPCESRMPFRQQDCHDRGRKAGTPGSAVGIRWQEMGVHREA